MGEVKKEMEVREGQAKNLVVGQWGGMEMACIAACPRSALIPFVFAVTVLPTASSEASLMVWAGWSRWAQCAMWT